MPAKERILDVSQLQPPEPLIEALDAVDQLQPGEYLHLLHRRDPHLLYSHLQERGMLYRRVEGKQAHFELLIWHGNDPVAAAACNPAD